MPDFTPVRPIESRSMMQNSQVSEGELAGWLLVEHYPLLYTLAALHTKDTTYAKKAAAQAVRTAVSLRHRYSGQQSLEAWLLSLTYRIAVDQGPKRRSGFFLYKKQGDKQFSGTKPYETNKADWDVEDHSHPFGLTTAALLRLSLRYVHGFSIEESAGILGEKLQAFHQRFEKEREQIIAAPQLLTQIRGGKNPGNDYAIQVAALEELQSAPHSSHLEARRYIRERADGCNADFKYESHIETCRNCSDYQTAFSVFENWLGRQLEPAWRHPDHMQSDIEEISREQGQQSRPQDRATGFRFSLSGYSALLLSILFLAVIGWYGGFLKPQKNVTLVVLSTITPSPESEAIQVLPDTPLPVTGSQPFHSKSENSAWPGYSTRNYLEYPEQLDELVLPFPAAETGLKQLSLLLHYWGWVHDPERLFKEMFPSSQDEAILLEELANLVEKRTRLRALNRYGGSMSLLKKLVQAGFPVLVQTGSQDSNGRGWDVQFETIYLVDEKSRTLTALTAASKKEEIGSTQAPAGERYWKEYDFDSFEERWQSSNYAYLVVFPRQDQDRIKENLGMQAYANFNLRYAAVKAANEASNSSGRKAFLASFNLGANLLLLGDTEGAADIFDQAQVLFEALSYPEKPWQIWHYRTEPMQAYYQQGRYKDVLDLTDHAISRHTGQPMLDLHFWRSLARKAVGDAEGAAADLVIIQQADPEYVRGYQQLQRTN